MTNNFNSINTYSNFLRVNSYSPSAPVQTSITTPAAPNTSTRLINTKTSQPIASVPLNPKSEQSDTLTKTVAALAIAASVVGLFFARGFSSSLAKKMNSYIQILDDKIFDYTQKYNSLGTVQRFYLKLNKGLQQTLNSMKVLNNLTAIKDSGFKWICAKLYLTKPMNWATEQFRKITINSSAKAYQQARNVADMNISKLREFIPKIQDKKTAALFEQYLNKLEKEFLIATNSTTRNQRLNSIKKATNGVGDQVSKELWEIFRKPNKEKIKKLGIYRTEVKAAEGRKDLEKTLLGIKNKLSCNIEDKQKILIESRDEIAKVLDVKDKGARSILRNISKKIKEYGRLSGPNEHIDRQKIVEEIQADIINLKKQLDINKYSKEETSLLLSQIERMQETLQTTTQKGIVEDILQTLNQTLKQQSPQDYQKAKQLTKEIRKALNKAVTDELKLYDKFAEYSVGSAPTDVVGLLLPVAGAGYAISRGKDKEEKVSATLKAGIPISGGVLTTFIATAKMLTNLQGLAIGATTGLILNAIGSKVDEQYKEHNKKQIYVKKALEAYKPNQPIV